MPNNTLGQLAMMGRGMGQKQPMIRQPSQNAGPNPQMLQMLMQRLMQARMGQQGMNPQAMGLRQRFAGMMNR